MTQEDYVSFETAKMLEEKGYLRSCNATYFRSGVFVFGSEYQVSEIKAPTLSEAAKWLREEYGLHISVGMASDYSTDADGNVCDEWEFWTFDLYYTTNFSHHLLDCYGEYDTYEQALDKGIFEALKLI